MKRFSALALGSTLTLCALVSSSSAWIAQSPTVASSGSPLLITSGGAPGDYSDLYYPIGYRGLVGTVATTKTAAMPFAGTFKTIRFWQASTISTGSYEATLYLDGSATALKCTVNSTTNTTSGGVSGTMCTASIDAAFTAGQYASVLLKATGAPGFAVRSFVLSYTPTTAGDVMIPALGNGYTNTNAHSYSAPFSNHDFASTALANRQYSLFAMAGAISHFWVNANDPGSGKSYTYTALHNGSTTGAPTCTITGTGALVNPTCNDTAHTVSVSACDDVEFDAAPSATDGSVTAPVAAFGLRFVPTTAGDFPLIVNGNFGPADDFSAKFYFAPTIGRATGSSATEADVETISEAMTIKGMCIKTSSAPGTGKTRRFTLRVNRASSGFSCDLTGTNTTASCTASPAVTINAGDLIDTEDDPTIATNAAVGAPTISYVANR